MNNDAPVKNILIIRLSALGDVVLATGLISSLRARFPDARIFWLVQAGAAPLLAHNRNLHGVIVAPRERWGELWKGGRRWQVLKEAWALRRKLRKIRFDLALDAQGLLKSAIWAWLSGAPRRVSLYAREGGRLFITERLAPNADDSMISSEHRFLAEYLGARPEDFRYDLAIGEEPKARAAAVLEERGVRGDFVAFCPFTTRPQKHWLDERWIELARHVVADEKLTPVLFGGPGNRAGAARLVGQAAERGVRLVDLCGLLKLDESVAALARSRLVVGVDTGLTHMGTALGLPTIALFGSTRPYLETGSTLTKVLYERLPCSPCHRHPTCNGRFDCMRLHTVESVAKHLKTMLSQTIPR